MEVFAFEGSARKEGDTAQKRMSVKKQLIKVMTVVMQFLKFKRGKLPIVCVFGHNGLQLATPIQEDYEEKRLDCRCYLSDSNLEQILIRDRPHIIITIGNRSSFLSLRTSPFEIQKRWLHYDTLPDITQLGIDAYNCY